MSEYEHVKGQSKMTAENIGFTLIELLVVIAIIGILTAVLRAALAGFERGGSLR